MFPPERGSRFHDVIAEKCRIVSSRECEKTRGNDSKSKTDAFRQAVFPGGAAVEIQYRSTDRSTMRTLCTKVRLCSTCFHNDVKYGEAAKKIAQLQSRATSALFLCAGRRNLDITTTYQMPLDHINFLSTIEGRNYVANMFN